MSHEYPSVKTNMTLMIGNVFIECKTCVFYQPYDETINHLFFSC